MSRLCVEFTADPSGRIMVEVTLNGHLERVTVAQFLTRCQMYPEYSRVWAGLKKLATNTGVSVSEVIRGFRAEHFPYDIVSVDGQPIRFDRAELVQGGIL